MHTEEIANLATPEMIAELVSMAWQTFIGSEIVPVEDPFESADVVCSSISITGPWSATLLLYCTPEGAAAQAAQLLGLGSDEVEEGDTLDIMGELANIVGGNLKGAVSDDDVSWKLSLPVVSNGMQTVPGSQLTVELSFIGEWGAVGCQLRENTL